MELRADDAAPRPGCRLVVEEPPALRGVRELRGSPLALGRSEECDVVLGDSAVSRRHARLEFTPDGWAITDLDSSTGTWVDGLRVELPQFLREGAKLRIGRVRLTFESVQAAAPIVGEPISPAPGTVGPVRPRAATDADPLVGAQLGELRVLERIGVGATGRVYRARQEHLGREVAVKVLSAHLAADPEKVEAFLREARAEARLVHPSIVTVFDAGRSGEHVYFIMELMDAGALDVRLAATPGGRLPWKQAFPMLLSAARGLAYLHEQGILHRDLKPANLLLKSTGETKIADLGIALHVRDAARAAKAGTPQYAAPEVVRGEPASVAADLYSLGATFHHVLTGRTVFEGHDRNDLLRKVADGHRPRVLQRAPDVPGWLATAVDRLTSARTEERFVSAAELVEALQETDVRRRAREMGLTGGVPEHARAWHPTWRTKALAGAGLVGLAWALVQLSASEQRAAAIRHAANVAGRTATADEDVGAPSEVPDEENILRLTADTLRDADTAISLGRPVGALEAVLAFTRDPSVRSVAGPRAEVALEDARRWLRERSEAYRATLEQALLDDQARLATAYRSGLETRAGARPTDDMQAVLRLRQRAAAIDEMAAILDTAPMRRRAAALAARLRRIDATWQALMIVLADARVIGAEQEFRGVPGVPKDAVARLCPGAPPTPKRITFEYRDGSALRNVPVAWSDFGARALATRLVAPFAARMEPAFRAEVADLLVEAGCAEGATACLQEASAGPVSRSATAEANALQDLFAAWERPGDSPERMDALAKWARTHRRTDVFLRYAGETAMSSWLSLDDAGTSEYFPPADDTVARPR